MGWLGDNSGACCVRWRSGAGRLMRGKQQSRGSWRKRETELPGGPKAHSRGPWVPVRLEWLSGLAEPSTLGGRTNSDAVFPEPGWVAGSVLSWLSLPPAAAFSSARDSGWDGLVLGAAVHLWGVWKPKIPREPAPQGSPLSRCSTHAREGIFLGGRDAHGADAWRLLEQGGHGVSSVC